MPINQRACLASLTFVAAQHDIVSCWRHLTALLVSASLPQMGHGVLSRLSCVTTKESTCMCRLNCALLRRVYTQERVLLRESTSDGIVVQSSTVAKALSSIDSSVVHCYRRAIRRTSLPPEIPGTTCCGREDRDISARKFSCAQQRRMTP